MIAGVIFLDKKCFVPYRKINIIRKFKSPHQNLPLPPISGATKALSLCRNHSPPLYHHNVGSLVHPNIVDALNIERIPPPLEFIHANFS